MPYSNLALDADRENGPAARSFAADAHDRIMVRIKRSYRIQVCGTKMRPQWRAPLGSLNRPTDRHRSDTEAMPKARLAVHRRSACSGVKALRNTSHARRQAAKLCYRFGPLTPSARSANLIAGDGTKNGLSRSEQKTGSTTQNNRLTGKAPYRFESGFLQRRVQKLSVPPLASRDLPLPEWLTFRPELLSGRFHPTRSSGCGRSTGSTWRRNITKATARSADLIDRWPPFWE